MIRAVTNIGRIKCTGLELVLGIVNTIHSRWTKFPSIERPAWAKPQQRFEKQVPTHADVKPRGSRAITLHISANQALDRKETLPAPNPGFLGVRGFSVCKPKNHRRKTKFSRFVTRNNSNKWPFRVGSCVSRVASWIVRVRPSLSTLVGILFSAAR